MQTSQVAQLDDKGTLSEENQFVTFSLGDETYGVSVLSVQEIIGMAYITHVPSSLQYMKGVINMRGAVVPVIDMRIRFNMPLRAYDSNTVIIIIESRNRQIGMIVDSVSDVLGIPVTGIHETPQFSSNVDRDFIKSIGRVNENLIIILNVERIISGDSEEFKDDDRYTSGKIM